jgi:hypothetical protein
VNAPRPSKPAFGSPCNGCGRCCEEELCSVAEGVFEQRRGPCPALLLDVVTKRSLCGLMIHPEMFAPEATDRYGRKDMGQAVALLVGVGHGCDAIAPDEPEPSPAILRMIESRAQAIPLELAHLARRLWGVQPP